MPYSIEIENLNELRDRFARSPIVVGEHLERATKEAGADILRTEVKEAPHDTGNLQRSIDMVYQPIQVSITPKANYALNVVRGSSPHTVPIQFLEGWGRRHGISPYAIQKAIQKKGTRANDFIKRTIEESGDRVRAIFRQALTNIKNEI